MIYFRHERILQDVNVFIYEKVLTIDKNWRFLKINNSIVIYCRRSNTLNIAEYDLDEKVAYFFSYEGIGYLTVETSSPIENTYGDFHEFAERNANSILLR